MANRSVLGSLEPFVPGNNFEEYLERLQQFFMLNEVQENKKVSFLITFLGQEAYSLLRKLTLPESPTTKTYEMLITILREHFAPEINVIAEHYKFHKKEQPEGETIGDYIVQLKVRAQYCNFGTFLDDALRDRLVFGLKDSTLQAQLLKKKDLTFEKSCKIAISWELAEQEIKAKEGSLLQINSMQKKKQFKQPPTQKRNHSCGRCGGIHKEEQCFARTWTCNKCGKIGHLAKKCRTGEAKYGFRNQTGNRRMDGNWNCGKDRKIKEVSEQEAFDLNLNVNNLG